MILHNTAIYLLAEHLRISLVQPINIVCIQTILQPVSIILCREWMTGQGHDFDAIWQQIEELVVLSLLSVQPLLQLNYRTAFPATNDGFSCFELLGYDVLLDEKCRPWLLEVSRSILPKLINFCFADLS